MKLERIGPAARGDEAGVLLAGGHRSLTKSAAKTQRRTIPPMPDPSSGTSIAQWRASLVAAGLFEAVEVVDGDALGPIGVLGSPRVCVGFGPTWTAVWIERLPWGWSDPYRLFLSPRSRSAISYALALAGKVRGAAQAELDRQERQMKACIRERGERA